MFGVAVDRGEELAYAGEERDLPQLAAREQPLVVGFEPGFFRPAVSLGIHGPGRSVPSPMEVMAARLPSFLPDWRTASTQPSNEATATALWIAAVATSALPINGRQLSETPHGESHVR
jgi:hypothetical protein